MEEPDAAYCDDVGRVGDDKGVKSPLVTLSCWREGVECRRRGPRRSPGVEGHGAAATGVTHPSIGDLVQVLLALHEILAEVADLGRLGFAHPLALCDAVWYVEEEGTHQGGDQAQQRQPVEPTRKAA